MREWLLRGLLETGRVLDGVYAIRDGVVNLFIVSGPAGLICIDAGWRPSVVARALAKLGLNANRVAAVFLTHSHWDHARGTDAFPGAKVYVGEGESAPRSWHVLSDGQMLQTAGIHVRAVATPGHTAGSMSYLVDDHLLFTGDAVRLRRGEVIPNVSRYAAQRQAMKRSVEKIAAISGVQCLLTAHCGFTREVPRSYRPGPVVVS